MMKRNSRRSYLLVLWALCIWLPGLAACIRQTSDTKMPELDVSLTETPAALVQALENSRNPDICTKQYTFEHVEAILNAALQLQDLPSGWVFESVGVTTDIPGMQGASYKYRVATETNTRRPVGIGQAIAVFRWLEDAKKDYAEQTEALPANINYEATSLVDFNSQADDHRVLCYETNVGLGIPYTSCNFAARYGCNTLVILGDTFADRWFTAQQYRQVIIAAEKRLLAVMADEEKE